jgi:uncharacterized membrane protein
MTASIPGGLSGAATGAERATASSPEQAPEERARPEPPGLEQRIARLLTIGTWAAVGLLVVGLVLMLASGIAPLSGGPAFDPSRLPGDLVALRPAGFIWLGLLVVVATPSARVVASLIGYARRGESRMAVIAVLILVVIGASVALAKGLQG